MRIVWIASLALGISIAAIAPAQSAPATTQHPMAPASAASAAAMAGATTKHVADFSEPRKAVYSFLTAETESDVREALIIEPARQADIDLLVKTMGAQMRLERAAAAQYGAAGGKEFAMDPQLQADRLRLLDAAKITIAPDGTSATVQLPGNEELHEPASTLTAKKVAGLWKLDAASVFNFDVLPKDQLAQDLKVAAAVLAVTEQSIKDVEAKKYGTAREAREAFYKASIAAVQEITQPSSTKP